VANAWAKVAVVIPAKITTNEISFFKCFIS
jgi:hypothetical protein